MPVLTAIDVLGVQRFIFSSNRLKDVVAGSWLVYWATSLEGALIDLISKERVLLAAGGNAILKFDNLESAKDFAAKYTRRLYKKAPGLEVALVHYEYKNGQLATGLITLHEKLARTKLSPFLPTPILGLSVTATCRETGLPASGVDPDDSTVPLSAMILKRRQVIKDDMIAQLWQQFLPERRFEFPLELDDLGRTIGDTSLIGIVHVDGNSVGAKIKDWLEDQEGAPDEDVQRQYQEWSNALDELAHKVFKAVVNQVCKAIKNDNGKIKICGSPQKLNFELKEREGKILLPLRPILLGGDDLTFVCDGRLALDLAVTALQVFRESKIPHLKKITARAGVAIVRSHDPFFRAYRLCEELCVNAKRRLREEGLAEEECALDWHIDIPHPNESLASLRKSLYQKEQHELTARPYTLDEGPNYQTWTWFNKKLLRHLRGADWKKHRNKVKKLLELAYEGPEKIKRKLEIWQTAFPDLNLKLPEPINSNGFAGGKTPLVDAVELLDIHLSLEKSEGQI
jgi:hypothetical protein